MIVRIMACGLVWLSIVSTQPADTKAAASIRVPLVVRDGLGVARAQEMVCSGVPLARGVLKPDTPVHIETRDGKALCTQTKVLGRWRDGCVKWLLVQFAADCPPNGQREYVLVPGAGPPASATLAVEDGARQVAIDTGALKVVIPKQTLTMLGDVSRRGDGGDRQMLSGPSPMEFTLVDGKVHSTAGTRPESITVEEDGPVRATVHVVGWLEGPQQERSYKVDARLRFYAGQSYVRGDYTFICLGQPALHEVKEIAVELSPAIGRGAQFVLPGRPTVTQGQLEPGQTALLSVDSQMVCRVGLEPELSQAEERLDGWGCLAASDGALAVAVSDFWHLCPKAIALSPGRIELQLWSGRSGENLRLGRTRAKTHRVLFDFHGRAKDAPAMSDRARAFAEPLIATADPTYFCTTDALGPLSPAGAAETVAYDKAVEGAFETLHGQRETMPRENGMLHYGDYYHGGYGNKLTRGDLEYDTGHAAFLLYARSGRRKYLDFAAACNQHFIDIDVNQETGDQRFHGYGTSAETHEEVTTSLEWGHVFVDCAADAYYLTGDERSLRAVRMIADRVASIAEGQGDAKIRNIFAGAERQLGWPLSALCRAYEVTGDAKYLAAAEKVVAYVKRYAEDPLVAYGEGKWWRSWMMDGCKVFMTGELHDGLADYYEQTGDQQLRDVIVKSLDWLIDHMWNPEVDGFVYEFNAMNRGHRQAGLVGLNLLIVDAFRVGYEITGDRRYLAVCTRAFGSRVRELTAEVDGKQFSMDTRTSPHTAAYFWREHLAPDNLPSPPQPVTQQPSPAPTGPRPAVLLEAKFEDNLDCQSPQGVKQGQAVGKIAYVPGRRGQALAVGTGGYAWLPAPEDMLRRPGSIAFWVRLNFTTNQTSPGQRAVFHVEGETPLVDSLAACTIYGDLRVRMKDHVGHLNGSAEGPITAWEPEQWRHVVITWDESRVRLYLDGTEQTRPDEGEQSGDAVSALPAGKQTRINLGWRFGNWYCDCAIDELTVYGRAVSGEEVAALCEQ